jgi:hypothetical protein
MRRLIGLALFSGLAMAALPAMAESGWVPRDTGAEARVMLVRDGCPRYMHKNDWGTCEPDRRIKHRHHRHHDYDDYRRWDDDWYPAVRYYRAPPPPPGVYFRGPNASFFFGFGY